MILHIDRIRQQYAAGINNMTYLASSSERKTKNPTMKKAIKLMDIEQDKNWILAIEQMETTLPEKHAVFLKYRREAEAKAEKATVHGRPSWVGYVQAHYNNWYNEKYNKEICISEDTLKNWQSRIVDKTVRIAIYNGCFAM